MDRFHTITGCGVGKTSGCRSGHMSTLLACMHEDGWDGVGCMELDRKDESVGKRRRWKCKVPSQTWNIQLQIVENPTGVLGASNSKRKI